MYFRVIFVTKSMTEGKPLKLILQFAVPLLFGNLLQQMYNLVDAAIVGRVLGTGALAAVGATSSVQFLVLGFCIGFCIGFGIPIAKSFGAERLDKMRSYIFNSVLLTALFAVLITAVCSLCCTLILQMLSVPQDVFDDAYAYLIVIFLGIPFTLLYNLLSSILRSVGDSRTPFLFLAISTVLNIGLDLLCIIVFKWGVAGAAIATIAAQAVSGILCLIYIRFRVPLLTLSRADCKADAESIRDLVVMGIPMGLQTSITAIGSMVMQAANNGLGSVYVSGFTAGMRLKQFCMCPFDALGSAVSVFCGQNLGAKKPERIRQGVRLGVIVGVAYGFCIGLVMIFFGRSMSTLFVESSAGDVLDASAKYLRCMGYFFWSLGILNICRMATQGIGFSGRAVFSGVTEMFARSIVSLGFVGAFGYTAICFSDQTAWIAAVLYITPTCLHCIKKVTKQIEAEKANANFSESVG